MKLEKIISMADGPEKTSALAAWVQSLYAAEDESPVLVGGGAVELYTGGAYTTGDLDFVGHVPARVAHALADSGFRKDGRDYIHERGQVYLEFPGARLESGESTRMERFGKHSVLLISVEDLLVDRLCAWVFWKSPVDGANAFVLFNTKKAALDWTRLRSRAEEEDVLRALNELEEFAALYPEGEPPVEDLEAWANRVL
ncbi:MAG: hypothetical protein P8Z49_00895 [Acidobacteriota bacterium]